MSNRNKGQSSKDAPKEQAPASLPPPPTDPRLQVNPNLRRKRPVDELEEGEVGPQKAKSLKIKGLSPQIAETRLHTGEGSAPGPIGLSWMAFPFLRM